MPRPNDVGVGVAVVLVDRRADGDRVLLGLRQGAHGAGRWSPPGGWIDRSDKSIAAAASREVYEETGIVISAQRLRRLDEATVDYPENGFRTVTLFLTGVVDREPPDAWQPQRREPHKCAEWRWFRYSEIPWENLMDTSVVHALRKIRSTL